MKNFKRVISAVIALALSVSSLVAVNASGYTDVADTASYAEAVEVLSALGIVSGYDDGTFKPEGEVTRAEAAKMVVGAVNLMEEAEAATGRSQFTDVEDVSWATGYINVGVAQGYINGMGDGLFAPESNVTYAQMCKMLSIITNYGSYAQSNGGYPNGYVNMAAQVGINKGVSVGNDTNLTRAQVAQMIYNALTTPMLGVVTYTNNGNEYSQLDGRDDREFKTLLSSKFNGYVVTANITATAKSGGPSNGEVNLEITKADQWDDRIIKSSSTSEPENGVIIDNNIDVDANLFQTGKAVLVADDNDDWHLVYFAATGKTDTKSFDAASYVEPDESGVSYTVDGKIKFDSKSYTLADTITVYVNGTKFDTYSKNASASGENATLAKLLENAQGEITLIDNNDATTAKGYDVVLLNYYDVAKVTSNVYKNEQSVLQFTLASGSVLNSSVRKITFNDDAIEAGDADVKVYKDDAEISVKDIQKDDIIAIATDMKASATSLATDPANITILVTSDTVTGKVSSKSTTNKTYTIGDETYEAVNWADTTTGSGAIQVKYTYTFTLDPFGRIYTWEEDSSSKAYAILEKYTDSGEKVQMVLADGTIVTYGFDSTASTQIAAIIGAYGSATTSTQANIKDRVVEYTYKKSTGELTGVTKVTTLGDLTGTNAVEFKGNTNKLGSYTIGSSTNIINAQEYGVDSTGTATKGNASDYAVETSLSDGVRYEAYVLKTSSSSVASLVILTEVGTKLSEESRFAVVIDEGFTESYTEDEDDCYELNVLYNGEEVTLQFEYTSAISGTALTYGDVFYFEQGSDGLVDKVYKVIDYTRTGWATMGSSDTWRTLLGSAVDKADWNLWNTDGTAAAASKADEWINADKDDVALVYGIVTDAKSNMVQFAQMDTTDAKAKIDLTDEVSSTKIYGYKTFGIASDAVAYTYDPDTTGKEANKFGVLTPDAVQVSNIDMFETSKNSYVYEENSTLGNINNYLTYALAMVVDGDIVAMVTYIQ